MTEAQRRTITVEELAAALQRFNEEGWKVLPGFPPDDPVQEYQQQAAAIFAALPAEQPAAGLCRYCETEITDSERLCPSRGFSLWCVPVQPARPAEAALREVLERLLEQTETVLGAIGTGEWPPTPDGMRKALEQAHAALAAQPTPPEETR